MNGLFSKLVDKSQDYKDGFSDGFRYAWQLSQEQLEAQRAINEREIERLTRMVKANSTQTVVRTTK